VGVDAQTLTALVQPGGTWNITPASLPDGTRDVTASVFDPAGNEGNDTQALTIDTTPPAVTIDGGANALTNDATPVITGTAIVPTGATVTVTLADETLTTSVQPGGTWSVTAAALSDGPHRIVMSVADAAGNPAGFTQRLTVDTVAPLVAITGGATATTEDTDPTITGTSDAAPGTTVTVTIAGQSMSTLVQANGTWNTTPNVVGKGTWTVVASDPDPAGNVGSASQTLTIGAPVIPPATTTPPHEPLPTPAPPATPPPGTGGLIDAVTGTTVARSATQKVHGFPLMIQTKVTAPANGPVVATATGTVRIDGVKPSIRLTTASIAIDAGRSATLKLRPKGSNRAVASTFRTIRAATRRHRKVTATITVRLVDAGGRAGTVTRTVKLTR
jgi:Bacterial Ig-like domain